MGRLRKVVRGLAAAVVGEPLDFLCDFSADRIADKTDRHISTKWIEDAVP